MGLFLSLSLCVCVCVCVHGILQARILQWVAFFPPGDLPDPGTERANPCLLHCRQILYCSYLTSPISRC